MLYELFIFDLKKDWLLLCFDRLSTVLAHSHPERVEG